MNICPNCGQSNASESRFCRFCGFQLPQSAGEIYSPPRPYVWQTDEFEAGIRSESSTAEHRAGRTAIDLGSPAAPIERSRAAAYPVGAYRCPRCGTNALPIIERRISPAGWITFAVLLVTTFIFFWIGLLLREDVRVCPVCGFRLN